MHHLSPANIPQRVIEWWKTRSKEDTSASTPDKAGESDNVASLRDRATGIGSRARNVAGGVQSRGKGAVEDLKRRRQGEIDSESGEAQQSVTRIGDRARGAASGAGALARGAMTRASGMRTGSQADPVEGTATGPSTPGQASAGPTVGSRSGSTEQETPLDPSSVAWASTAGVIDPELSNPSTFIEAEQSPASGSAQDTGDPDTSPGDRAAATPHVDTTAQVAGNAEEGTRNEAASAATQARTNSSEDKPLVQAPDDPIGGSEDRTPGTGSAETSSEPFAYASSADSASRDRDDPPSSGEAANASPPVHVASSTRKIEFARRVTDPATTTTSQDRSSASDDAGEAKASEPSSMPPPAGDDGLPIYFDTDDRTRSAAQSSDLAGLSNTGNDPVVGGQSYGGDAQAVDAAASSRERPALGADKDDGSSITELEAETSEDEPAVQSRSTTLSGDAYRSTAAPEAVVSDDSDAGDVRHPEPGSSIPNFATDADSPTRIVESPADSDSTSEQKPSRNFGSVVSGDPGDERQAGSGVTKSEPTSRVPGEAEPVPDPASGRARAGGDTGRRGTSGLGAGPLGSSASPRSSDDVNVADVVSSDDPGKGMEASDAVTQQDAAGAVDTSDPEGISRSITRDAASPNDGAPSGGRNRRRRKGKSDERPRR